MTIDKPPKPIVISRVLDLTQMDPDTVRERWKDRIRIVLAASRRDEDVSQRELRARIGVTRNTIANLESGRLTVRMVDFVMIAIALKINPSTILDRILRW